MNVRTAGLAAALLLPFALPATAAEPVTYRNLLTPLLSTTETVIGQPLAYPAGTPKVTAAVVTVPPGGETGWHSHQVPLFAYILEGEISVDYGTKGVKVFKPGEGLMEAMNWPHNATNKGTVPVRILAVYAGVDGVANADAATGPQ